MRTIELVHKRGVMLVDEDPVDGVNRQSLTVTVTVEDEKLLRDFTSGFMPEEATTPERLERVIDLLLRERLPLAGLRVRDDD